MAPEILQGVVMTAADRLDRGLADQFPHLSRSRLQKLIEQGQVQVNHQICLDKHRPIQPGDRLQVTIPPSQPLELPAAPIPLEILYEDASLIIVNKPAGLVVHPAPGHPDGTLVNALLAHCPDLVGIGGVERPGIVHRLDKDTTGAIAVAKTDQAFQHLQAQLKAKTAQRIYWGIVHGNPKTAAGTVNLPLGRHPQDRQKMAILPLEKGGREAVTHWQLKERLGNYSWLEFRLETGRTHQIRVHSKQMGHPILGDPVYSTGHAPVKLPGQALHAYQLSLIHPVTEESITAIAPPPQHFEKLLTYLRQRC
ncbi:MAG: RluA family pseudouridine synthase [Microcystaceae cyanobacterium]